MKRKQEPKRGAASPSFNWGRSKLITQASVLAKRANQRLREIEKQGLQTTSNAYQYVERAAFDKKGWTATTSSGQITFHTNFRNMTDDQIREALRQLKAFEQSKTSLTKGVRKKLETLTEKFNKKINETAGEKRDYSTEEFAQVMSQNLTKQLFNIFDPSEIMRLFAEDDSYLKNAETILAALVAKEKRSLAEMSFSTVARAFHDWKSNTIDESTTVDEDKPPWEF